MRRGLRYLLAVALGFVAYRVTIAIVPTTTGLVISLLLGVIVAFGVWRLTAPKETG